MSCTQFELHRRVHIEKPPNPYPWLTTVSLRTLNKIPAQTIICILWGTCNHSTGESNIHSRGYTLKEKIHDPPVAKRRSIDQLLYPLGMFWLTAPPQSTKMSEACYGIPPLRRIISVEHCAPMVERCWQLICGERITTFQKCCQRERETSRVQLFSYDSP